jgi:hypothetical protein
MGEDAGKLIAFDRHVRDAREALTSAQDADFTVLWSLKKGDPDRVAIRRW